MEGSRVRVLLVDDHQLVWNGTRRLLEQLASEIDARGLLAFSAERDVDSACRLGNAEFDLVLLDYHLPGTTGLDALRRIQSRFDGASVCMLSGESGREQIRSVLEAGASGFIPKAYSETEMASALRLVLRQKAYAPMEFLMVEEVMRGPQSDEIHNEDLARFLRTELSPRQRQVLSLALQGMPNKSIARRLEIAEGTVKVHLSMVYRALGVRNRVGALCRVLQADATSALETP